MEDEERARKVRLYLIDQRNETSIELFPRFLDRQVPTNVNPTQIIRCHFIFHTQSAGITIQQLTSKDDLPSPAGVWAPLSPGDSRADLQLSKRAGAEREKVARAGDTSGAGESELVKNSPVSTDTRRHAGTPGRYILLENAEEKNAFCADNVEKN